MPYARDAERKCITDTMLVCIGMCEQSSAYNIYATLPVKNPLFPGFSRYQNINKEISSSQITSENSQRDNCDFGKGFYLGETYNQALSFVCEKEKSSVYSFKYSLSDLKVKRFDCNLEWMLAICGICNQ